MRDFGNIVMPSDIGKFVGRYFQVWAVLSIVWMIVSALVFDALNADLSVLLLFWMAAYLIRHHPIARRWTILLCALGLLISVGLTVVAATSGTENMTLRIGSASFGRPTMLTVAIVDGLVVVLVGLPLALLLTRQAKREFGLEHSA